MTKYIELSLIFIDSLNQLQILYYNFFYTYIDADDIR